MDEASMVDLLLAPKTVRAIPPALAIPLYAPFGPPMHFPRFRLRGGRPRIPCPALLWPTSSM